MKARNVFLSYEWVEQHAFGKYMETMLQIFVWLHWQWTQKDTQARQVHEDLKNL